jgi:hypothetical protein
MKYETGKDNYLLLNSLENISTKEQLLEIFIFANDVHRNHIKHSLCSENLIIQSLQVSHPNENENENNQQNENCELDLIN